MIFGRYFARRRARKQYATGLLVLKHACVSGRYRDTPASEIGALEALKLWHDDKIEPPSLWEAIDRTPMRITGITAAEPLIPNGYELPEQTDLLSAATAASRPNARVATNP